jgi:hypothetical protein
MTTRCRRGEDGISFEHRGPCRDPHRHRHCPGLWRGELTTGYTGDGRRTRRKVSGCIFQGCRSWKRFGLRLQVSHVAAQTCMPEGLHGRAVGPSVPGEAAPGPLESLASASAEAYPAWVWPAHPVGGFAGSMPPRDRVHQQGGAIPLGGVAGAAVRATFSASARTIADAAQVLPGRTGGPGCHGG